MCYSDCNMQCPGVFVSCVYCDLYCDLGVPCAGDVCDELWRLSLSTLKWTLLKVPPGESRPSARDSHSMTSVGLDLWVHGGNTASGEGDV